MSEPASPTGVDTAEDVIVAVSDEQSDVEVDPDRWAGLAAAVAAAEGGHGELGLTFVDRDTITVLNRDHMGGDGPTDVLSFPLDAADATATDRAGTDRSGTVAGPTLLGDVVICPAVAAAQATDHAGTLDDELALLVVHGCLHLFGHDHGEPDETALMRRRELDLLVAHHWHGPAPAAFRQEHR